MSLKNLFKVSRTYEEPAYKLEIYGPNIREFIAYVIEREGFKHLDMLKIIQKCDERLEDCWDQKRSLPMKGPILKCLQFLLNSMAPITLTLISIAGIIIGLFCLLMRTPANSFEGHTVQGKVIRIVDGDSLYISNHDPQTRLWGVDAPERKNPGFHEATNSLHTPIATLALMRSNFGRITRAK